MASSFVKVSDIKFTGFIIGGKSDDNKEDVNLLISYFLIVVAAGI